MTTIESPSIRPATLTWDDELFHLQLRVARRADELSRGSPASRAHDLEIWFQAEREVLEGSRESRDIEAAALAVA
jgi:hypothetical protein